MADQLKEKKGQSKKPEQNKIYGIPMVPTMPYYCTWIPAACPAESYAQVDATPPPYIPPVTGAIHPTYYLAWNCWCQKIYTHHSTFGLGAEEEVAPEMGIPEEVYTPKPPPDPKPGKKDNLKIVEGIGPKIEGLLNQEGIYTWLALSKTPIKKLRDILAAAGRRYAIHDPKTWAKQAKLAATGKWKELEIWQKELKGGK